MRTLRFPVIVLLAASLTFACSDQQPIPTEPTVSLDPVFARGGQGKGQKVSYALEFDGGSTGTWTADAAALDLGSAFTLELWVKPDAAERVNPRQDFVSKWGSGTSASYAFWLRANTLRLSTRQDPTGNTVTYGAAQLANGVWQHVAAVFDNGTVRLYLDGALDVETTGNLTPQNSTTVLSLGRELSSFEGAWYDGMIDEVRIWSVARTQREIQKNMNKKINTNRVPAGLVAYWRMDEGTGDQAFDLTGNGHDMRLGDNDTGTDDSNPVWVTPGMP
jgi:hypothetical protein